MQTSIPELADSKGRHFIPTPDNLILMLDEQGGIVELTLDGLWRELAEVEWWAEGVVQ